MDYNWIIEKIYKAFLKEGDVAIDVGAYHGRHTFPMAESVAPSGRILAFEPVSKSRKILQEKLKEEHREFSKIISIYPYALADYEGRAEFIVAVDTPDYSGLKKRVYDSPTRLKKVLVPIKTIDYICSGLTTLRIIKIDVEGGEVHVLKGAEETIKKFRPLVIFEFGEKAFGEYQITPADMIDFWSKRNYKIYDILGDYLEPEIFIQRVHRRGKVWDYIALPEELHALEEKLVNILEISQRRLYGKPRYSVIVPTYNREASLQKTLISLTGQTISPDQYEVLVIDDGSTRNIKEAFEKFLRQYGAKNFFYHRIPHGGPAKARNTGVKLARGKILFFTDDDCVVPHNWLEILLGGYRRHPKAVGVGGWEMKNPLVLARNRISQYMHSYDLDLLDRRLAIINNHSELCGLYYYESEIIGELEAYTKAGATGNMSYKKGLFEKIGGFDEKIYFPGHVDWEFQIKIPQSNYPLVYLPIFVLHDKSVDLRTFILKQFLSGRGRRHIAEKYKAAKIHPLRFHKFIRGLQENTKAGGITFATLWILHALVSGAGWYYESLKRTLLTVRRS